MSQLVPVHRYVLTFIVLANFSVDGRVIYDFIILTRVKNGTIHQLKPFDSNLSKRLDKTKDKSITVIFFKERTYIERLMLFPSGIPTSFYCF